MYVINNSNESEDDNIGFRNPFIPPPIKPAVLKKKEKQEFIDFEDLISLNSSSTISQNYTMAYVDVDTETSALRFRPQEKKQKITNLVNWMTAWNKYMQAFLHFKPDMHYKMFCYQKIFCDLVSKYKFEGCYAYDKDIRMLLASQVSLPLDQRTVTWDKRHYETMNMYLHDNLLPLCYSCHNKGHYANMCPSKAPKVYQAGQYQPSNRDNDRFRTQSFFRNPSDEQQFRNQEAQNPRQQSNTFQQTPCQRYNKGSYCAKPPCQLAHVCNKCGRSNHQGFKCLARNVENTRFLP